MESQEICDSPMTNGDGRVELEMDDRKESWILQTEIVLTDKEKSIFEFLLEAVAESGKNTVLRAAGGWVRDKLMGRESDDIDIAIDNMFGEEMAEIVRLKNFKKDVESGKVKKDAAAPKGYGVIKANSDKSKHLETAVCKVMGEWVDLVNLRSEEYAQDSRVPTIDIGTPEQDALRRDLTFNSLFYNLNTSQIEDFTGRGISDLEQGIVRTPLEPLQTFLDDPLRVIRAIRFANRFGFSITDDFIKASRDPRILDAFKTKITQERITKELDKILSNLQPHIAIQQMSDFKITNLCIRPPTEIKEFNSDEKIAPYLQQSVKITNVLGILFNTLKAKNGEAVTLSGYEFSNCSIKNKEFASFQMKVFYSGLLIPFSGFEYTKKKKTITAVQHIIADSMKQSNEVQRFVSTNINSIQLMRGLVQKCNTTQDLGQDDRLELALALRSIGPNFGSVSLLSIAKEYQEQDANDCLSHKEVDLGLLNKVLQSYEQLNQVIGKADLRNIHLLKAMVDGKSIQVLYNCKPGRHIKSIIDECLQYQILNIAAEREQVEEYLKINQEEFLNKYK